MYSLIKHSTPGIKLQGRARIRIRALLRTLSRCSFYGVVIKLALDRGFVFIHAPLAVAADFVRIAAHAVADDSRAAAFAVVTNCCRAATALSGTANNSLGAAHAVAVGQVLAAAYSVVAGSSTAFSVAVDIPGRTADAIGADFRGVAAVGSANRVIGAAMGHWRRRLSAKSRGLQAKRRQYRASNGAADHAQHLAPRNRTTDSSRYIIE
jgi:hypothetical protein